MRPSITFFGVSVLLLWTSAVSAQTTAPVATPAPGTGKAVISGTAVDSAQTPIPKAIVRLRNLGTTQIDQTTVTDSKGHFTFSVRADVPYVVEIVDASGRILAVGDVVIPGAGEAVAAFVAIPAKLPTFAGMFTDTAGSVLSAAAGLGLTTIQAGVLPFLSPER